MHVCTLAVLSAEKFFILGFCSELYLRHPTNLSTPDLGPAPSASSTHPHVLLHPASIPTCCFYPSLAGQFQGVYSGPWGWVTLGSEAVPGPVGPEQHLQAPSPFEARNISPVTTTINVKTPPRVP